MDRPVYCCGPPVAQRRASQSSSRGGPQIRLEHDTDARETPESVPKADLCLPPPH
jgi:hypothetical protein